MAKAIQKAQRSAAKDRSTIKRARKILLSLLAIFVTLIPLLSATIWVKQTFFADTRHTITLEQMNPPATPVKIFEEPVISVTFDDGWESIYSKGALIFQKYGIRTTQYILSGTFDYTNYLSKSQILSLQAAGHDIESHTVGHNDLTALNDEDLWFELRQSKHDLSKLLGKEVTDFASPLNRYNDRVISVAEQVYRSHRNTEADAITLHEDSFNVASNFDPHQISAFSVRRTTTVEQLEKFMQEAKARKAWIVIIYHQIEDVSEDYYAVTPKQLDEQLAAIANSGLRIATIDEMMDAYEAKYGDQ